MTWLLEQPLPTLVMGVVLAAALIMGFLKTGQKSLLFATLAVVALAVGLLIAERMVVTDREQVEQVLFEIAQAVERNDMDGALRHVSPDAPGVEHARSELGRIQFQEVDIKPNLEIQVAPDRIPATAEARFNVVVTANVGLGVSRYPRYVEVTFEKQGDRWVVRDYSHYEPTRGMKTTP